MIAIDMTDDQLIKQCVSGDKKGWNIFIKKYSRLVYHTIYKTFRVNNTFADPDDVNDLFQEVFASLFADSFRKIRMFDPSKGCSSLASWLRMITVRMTIDHLRKSKPLTSIDDLPTEPSQAGDQEEIINEESLRSLRNLIEKLPAKDKLLVELFFMRELSPAEVAQILNMSVGAFYTRKNRIIEKLKNIAKDRNIL